MRLLYDQAAVLLLFSGGGYEVEDLLELLALKLTELAQMGLIRLEGDATDDLCGGLYDFPALKFELTEEGKKIREELERRLKRDD